METLHPILGGSTGTVKVCYRGTDTFRICSTRMTKIKRIDEYGDVDYYDRLSDALQDIFQKKDFPLLDIVGMFLTYGSIVTWEAQHIANRLRLEKVEGFGKDELDIYNVEEFTAKLKARGSVFFIR
ncbi:MAG: hypothetical protein QM758_00465 [Armatimonas sp.]